MRSCAIGRWCGGDCRCEGAGSPLQVRHPGLEPRSRFPPSTHDMNGSNRRDELGIVTKSELETGSVQDFIAYPSRWRLALLMLGALGFVALGLWFIGLFGEVPSSRRYSEGITIAIGWLCVLLFGLIGLGIAKKLFETGEQLRIGSSGVCWRAWSDQTIPWSEISNVTTWESNRQRMIILHLRDPARFPAKGCLAVLAGTNRVLTGGDVAISLTGTDRTVEEALDAVERLRVAGN
jgi:hypothetical protein